MPEPTNDLREKKNELEQKIQDAITKFETDTGTYCDRDTSPPSSIAGRVESTAGFETKSRAA